LAERSVEKLWESNTNTSSEKKWIAQLSHLDAKDKGHRFDERVID
jgi:hypothetical protein